GAYRFQACVAGVSGGVLVRDGRGPPFLRTRRRMPEPSRPHVRNSRGIGQPGFHPARLEVRGVVLTRPAPNPSADRVLTHPRATPHSRVCDIEVERVAHPIRAPRGCPLGREGLRYEPLPPGDGNPSLTVGALMDSLDWPALGQIS